MELQTNAALILIDQQQGILHPRLGRRNNPEAEERIAELLAYWRQTARPLIHVQHLSRSSSRCSGRGSRGWSFSSDSCRRALRR